ncbi:MAG: glycosyltransferase [Bacteroidia bacterium]|nr:glycosyltransferase [Bacteroidia bacterium]
MKILFVANRVPYPPYRGDKLKIYNIARRLSINHELFLITFAESKKELDYKIELEKIFSKVIIIYLPKWKSFFNCFLAIFTSIPLQVAYFKSKLLQQTIKHFLLNNKIDIIHTQHLRMSQFTKDIKIAKILDFPDAFSLYWKRRLENRKNNLFKIFENIEFKRLYNYEKNILKFYNLGLVCSVEDLNYIKKEHNIQNIALLKNGVDFDTFSSAAHDYSINDVIIFTGNMNYSPNIDAILYFANDIFPLILNKKNNVKFIIAGQKPVKSICKLKSQNIEVTGFVENLNEYYKKASVVISPLRFGAGTQNKVLEAMAMGIPVVCTKIGFEGLEVKNGEGVFCETNPIDFASRVIELLESELMRKKCGTQGNEIAKKNFCWDIIVKQLENYMINNL